MTFLELAVSMHGSESQTNSTTIINVLHAEKSRLKRGINDMKNAFIKCK
jgi:hypothetical protein